MFHFCYSPLVLVSYYLYLCTSVPPVSVCCLLPTPEGGAGVGARRRDAVCTRRVTCSFRELVPPPTTGTGGNSTPRHRPFSSVFVPCLCHKRLRLHLQLQRHTADTPPCGHKMFQPARSPDSCQRTSCCSLLPACLPDVSSSLEGPKRPRRNLGIPRSTDAGCMGRRPQTALSGLRLCPRRGWGGGLQVSSDSATPQWPSWWR